MKYLKQFFIIILISFIGELLNHFLLSIIPASIYGIVILLVCLLFNIIKLEDVKDAGNFLIEIMPVMFIPAAVGLINSYSLIKDSIIVYLIIIVVSTILVMAASGIICQKLVQKEDK